MKAINIYSRSMSQLSFLEGAHVEFWCNIKEQFSEKNIQILLLPQIESVRCRISLPTLANTTYH